MNTDATNVWIRSKNWFSAVTKFTVPNVAGLLRGLCHAAISIVQQATSRPRDQENQAAVLAHHRHARLAISWV
jgi:hypothetical protein